MHALVSVLPAPRNLPRLPLPPVARWWRVRRERRQLLELSDHMLRDVGLTRAEARREAARPFWDVPAVTGAGDPGRQPATRGHSSRP